MKVKIVHLNHYELSPAQLVAVGADFSLARSTIPSNDVAHATGVCRSPHPFFYSCLPYRSRKSMSSNRCEHSAREGRIELL